MSRFVRYWLPALVWLALIAIGSGAILSAQNTGGAVRTVLLWLAPGLTYAEVAFWHVVVRKSGHVLAYGIGAALWFRAVYRAGDRSVLRALLASCVLTLAVACGDELHQSMLPQRSGTPRDLIFDMAGALAGLVTVALLWRRRSSPKAEAAA